MGDTEGGTDTSGIVSSVRSGCAQAASITQQAANTAYALTERSSSGIKSIVAVWRVSLRRNLSDSAPSPCSVQSFFKICAEGPFRPNH